MENLSVDKVDKSEPQLHWEERAKLIRQRFPSTEDLDWKRTFNKKEEVFARIMRDILKVDQAVPGRPGPRPSLDYKEGMATLQRMMGTEFCSFPFPSAFKMLVGNRSITHISRKVGLSRSHVYRLLKGIDHPDRHDMFMIADGFGKHVSFFAEYRSAFVISQLEAKLMQAPESQIDFYKELSKVSK